MKSTSLAIVAVVLASAAIGAGSRPRQDAAARTGFVTLFNGRDLSGWKIPPGDNGHWNQRQGTAGSVTAAAEAFRSSVKQIERQP